MKNRLSDFARKARKVHRFVYMTVDRNSIKMWNEEPRWNSRGGFWMGDCVGFFNNYGQLNLMEYKTFGTAYKYSECIVKVEEDG